MKTEECITIDDQNIITQTSSGGTSLHNHKGNITRLNGSFYYYDDENQLTGVMLTPTKLYSFAYDGKRRKRKQVEFNLVRSTWTPIAETWYIYDGMTVIQERSNTNVPTVHYTRGLDLSGTPGGAGGIGGLLTRSSGYNASTGAWSTHDYEHADGSGNITMLISNSSTPTIRSQYEYDPFGRIQTQSGSLATANTQRFSSKEQIGTSPLSYYGYRFYHTDAQRWINRDPIEESGGLNLYGFVDNSPIDHWDLLGLQGGGKGPCCGKRRCPLRTVCCGNKYCYNRQRHCCVNGEVKRKIQLYKFKYGGDFDECMQEENSLTALQGMALDVGAATGSAVAGYAIGGGSVGGIAGAAIGGGVGLLIEWTDELGAIQRCCELVCPE